MSNIAKIVDHDTTGLVCIRMDLIGHLATTAWGSNLRYDISHCA